MSGTQINPINIGLSKGGWISLNKLQKGKWLLRAHGISKMKRVKDTTGHETNEIEAKGNPKVQPKLNWDISGFPTKT